MSPKAGEKVFEKAYAKTLLSIADEDRFSAEVLAKNSKSRKETSLFLVQQSIEKSLKAVLCHLEIPIPMVHDLGSLVGKLPDRYEPPYGYDLAKFNQYAGILRYERGHDKLFASDVKTAIKVAKDVHKWAQSILKGN